MPDDRPMVDGIKFVLDGREVTASPGETIWQAASRHRTEIPHLCYSPAPGYRPDGNCRACMVEIEGERVLAASCVRKPSPGMKVSTGSERAKASQKLVFELLVADQPERAVAHDPGSRFWHWAERVDVTTSRFPAIERPNKADDFSHPAMAVQLDACIHCNLCVRACREVQVNDVIGMAARGHLEKIVFDFDDPMGASTCVACGECVQACPTGALMPATQVDEQGVYTNGPDRKVDSVCPYCGVGCQLTYEIKDDRIVAVAGRDGPSNQNRLCVKGRFGFDYVHHTDRLTKPMIRKDGVSKHDVDIDPANPWTHFREATWEEALERAGGGLKRIRDERGGGGAGRLRLGQGLERGSLSVPEAGAHRLRHQQRRPLHAPVPRLVGGRASRGHRLGRRDGALHGRRERRRDRRDRRQPDREPSGRRDLLQERDRARRQARRHGPARPGPEAPRHAHAAVQAGPRRGHAQRHAAHDRRGAALRPPIRAGQHGRFRAARRERARLPAGDRWRSCAASRPRPCARWRGSTPAPKRPSSSGAWASASTSTAPTTRAA